MGLGSFGLASPPCTRTSYMCILEMSLPVDADDAFDERYVNLVGRIELLGGLYQEAVIEQLLALPLTPVRARRIVRLALERQTL